MKKITLSELKPIFEDYAAWLSEWQVGGKDTLFRFNGPVLQGLWLDRLRTGHFRPTFYIKVLAVPRKAGSMELCQFLTIRQQTIHPSRHKELFAEVISSVERNIFPSILTPLQLENVFYGYEKRAAPNPAETVSLAALAAYLGDSEKYRKWKNSFFELLDTRYTSAKERNLELYSEFFRQVEAGSESNQNKEFIESIISEQKKSNGLC